MKVDWDYTQLADHYLSRPDYSWSAIEAMLRVVGASPLRTDCCDIGAGTGHLTRVLAAHVRSVVAVEPNDAMRGHGIDCTANLPRVRWTEGIAEETGLPSGMFDLVTFGSSFNVTDRPRAMAESARLLRQGGWFSCMWNHRDLDDPLQADIESIIKERIPGYRYGARREDQTTVIDSSGLFGPVVHVSAGTVCRQTKPQYLDAWRSHATLARQAGGQFQEVLAAVAARLEEERGEALTVPFTTRVWMARVI